MDELQKFSLSCSIGVSRCPQDGMDFQNLFRDVTGRFTKLNREEGLLRNL